MQASGRTTGFFVMININDCIKNAMKSKDSVALSVYREIKSEILKYKTAKNAKPYDDVAEINLLKKIMKAHEETMEFAKQAGRTNIIEDEIAFMDCLSNLMPKLPTEEEIDSYVAELIPSLDGEVKMGEVIKIVKAEFPTGDGGMIARTVKKYLA